MIRSCWKWLYLQRAIDWDEGCRSRKSTTFMVVIKWYAWNHTDIYPGLTTGACILILEPKKGKSIITISSKNQTGSDEWNPQKLGNYPSGFSKLTESKQTLFIWGFRAPLQAYNSLCYCTWLHLNLKKMRYYHQAKIVTLCLLFLSFAQAKPVFANPIFMSWICVQHSKPEVVEDRMAPKMNIIISTYVVHYIIKWQNTS